jgi:hypothetical protein
VEDEELVALAQREAARVAAGLGDIDHAIALLHIVRAMFDNLGEPSEVWATDLALVEVYQEVGRSADAAASLAAIAAPGRPHASFQRIVAQQHLADGRADEARTLLRAALAAAEGQADRLEQGRILHELVALDGHADHDAARRARAILDSIGVVPRA